MAIPVHIPKLGMVMTEAELIEWQAKEGDWIEKGSKVLLIETEKVTWELEAPGAGFLHVLMEKGSKAEVAQVVALLAATREELEALQKEQPKVGAVTLKEAPALASQQVAEVGAREEEEKPVIASPAARRLAKEKGIDLTRVSGTGPGGRITEADVMKYYEEAPRPARITPVAERMAREAGLDISTIVGTGEREKVVKEDVEKALAVRAKMEIARPVQSIPLVGMRKKIAQNMFSSLHNTAQVSSFVEVDATEMVRFRDLLREEYKNDETVRISYNDIIVLATSRALKRIPIMNSALVGEEIFLFNEVNMGIAVAVPEGLIVPVLRDADKKGISQIARESRDLARKAREGNLSVEEVTGGTFTISNVSMFEVDASTPILRSPETGILGVGRVKEKPAVHNGQIAIRSMMFLSLTFDHRVIDGAPANEFLGFVVRFLQDPRLILT